MKKLREISKQNLAELIISSETIQKEIFKQIEERLFLSAIGGRVCYSSDLLNDINNQDKRLFTQQGLVDYVKRISKLQHYSIFAHTPIIISIEREIFYWTELFNLFKSKYDKRHEKLYINLRHVVEAIPEILEAVETKIIILPVFEIKEKYGIKYFHFRTDDYHLFYFHNITRRTSHQIVRHQSLNFNEKSLRYTKVKEASIPESLKYEYNDSSYFDYVSSVFEMLKEKYKIQIDRKVKPERARDILPLSTPTSIVLSGWEDDIQEFIKKRIDSSAQGEIQLIAKIMESEVNNNE